MPGSASRYDIEKIFDVVFAFNNERDYAKLLNIILDKMMELTRSDAGTLYMIEDGRLYFRIIKNNTLRIWQAGDAISLPPVVLDKDNIVNICAYAALKNEIVAVDDVYTDQRFNFNGSRAYDKLTGYRTRSMLTMPLTATRDGASDVLGVIQLLNAERDGLPASYGDVYDPPVLPALSQIAANTLANLVYTKEIHTMLHSLVAVMTQAIDERSPYNRHHTQNVSKYCDAFAQFLSERFPEGHTYHFDGGRREKLVMAAMLHDIGKIITPLHIMDKADRLGGRLDALRYRFIIRRHQAEIDCLSGRVSQPELERTLRELTDALAMIETANTAGYLPDDKIAALRALETLTYIDGRDETVPILEPADVEALTIQKGTLTAGERAVMQEHVSLTGRLLEKMAFNKHYKDVPRWARGHHELLDGTGYPEGLSGEDINFEIRVITIMDIFDALIASDRPYKKGLPTDRALDILRSMAEEGKLNKELVELFAESGIWAE